MIEISDFKHRLIRGRPIRKLIIDTLAAMGRSFPERQTAAQLAIAAFKPTAKDIVNKRHPFSKCQSNLLGELEEVGLVRKHYSRRHNLWEITKLGVECLVRNRREEFEHLLRPVTGPNRLELLDQLDGLDAPEPPETI